MRNLDEIRKDIDSVDSELKKLFIERMNLVKEVYLYKEANNLPVKNEKREEEIINKRTEGLSEFKNECEEFFKTLMDLSCKYQEQNLWKGTKTSLDFEKLSYEEFVNSVENISCQGIKGSYGNEMARTLFPEKNIHFNKTFREVCESVKNGSSDAGVLPIENLSAGSINEVYDLIEEYKLNIVMERELPISHCLLGCGELSDIKKVKSHPQALMQCASFIESMGYKKIECVNTAVAAFETAEANDKSIGVICNKINKDYYNLNLLKENISDLKDNKTKFIVVSNKKYILDNPEKISIVFSLPHKKGSLARVLNDFSLNGFNLSKIESRPVKSNKWEYLFYVDIEGNILDEKTKAHLEAVSYLFDYVRIIGNH